MVAPNPYAPFKAREDGRVAVLPVENPRLRRPRTCPRGEGTYTFSAAPGTEGTYLDEIWTLDKRSGGISVTDLNDGTGNDRHFYHSNSLFSVFALTDEAGAIAEAIQAYDSYGKVSALITGAGSDATWFTSDDVLATNPNASAVSNEFLFTGQRIDSESGLYYYKNRYYSAELGRFVTRDPIEYKGRVFGLYEYCFSRVTAFMDPKGFEGEGKGKKGGKGVNKGSEEKGWEKQEKGSGKGGQGNWEFWRRTKQPDLLDPKRMVDVTETITVLIRFYPQEDKCSGCEEIALYQATKDPGDVPEEYKDVAAATGWRIDKTTASDPNPHPNESLWKTWKKEEGPPSGLPPQANNGYAVLMDPVMSRLEHRFLTCAICIKPANLAGTNYGCVSWTIKGKDLLPGDPGDPNADFTDAVNAWNKAKGKNPVPGDSGTGQK